MLLRRSYGLDTLELKALSVPSSLRFLLGVEYDVVLCVTEVGARRPFSLHFPCFADTFRKLLSLCAKRFSLHCQHDSNGSVLSGVAVMPLLRYADYLPCALHVEELLAALQVAPVTRTLRRGGAAATNAPAASSTKAATTTPQQRANSTGANEFTACFLDYSEFSSDASLTDVHGLGFYLMHDYGLSIATHGHLLLLKLHRSRSVTEALHEFQRFSGWTKFDLRFFDEQDKAQGGVIVMPTVQDACDLLERYEDEDSDDEGELLPFVLRPVLPLVPVPSIEDSALRRLRQEHWGEIERFWERFPTSRNTVVLYGLHDGATLQEVRAIVHGLPVTACKLVEDDSPMHRRRAFITLASAAAARKALELDGKSTRGRTLRVQVAPPYISETRWGREVAARPTPAVLPDTPSHPTVPKAVPKPRSQVCHVDIEDNSTREGMKPGNGTRGVAAEPATTEPPTAADHAPPAAAKSPPLMSMHANCHPSKSSASAVVAAALVAAATNAVGQHSTTRPSPTPSSMNVRAKEFVPTFVLHADSPEFRPADVPSGGGGGFTVVEGAESNAAAAPPPYANAVSAQPPGLGFTSPPLSAPVSVSLSYDFAAPEHVPPPYGLPPPYRGSSGGASAVVSGRASAERGYDAAHAVTPRPPPPPPPPPPYTRL